MIESIRGKVISKLDNTLVLQSGDISYLIYLSEYSKGHLSLGDIKDIYIEMVLREDSISLYGFSTEDERAIYRLLTTVKGVGPRTAIGILSGIDPQSLVGAIKSQDTALVSQAPGVGKKTAERIILELKDKVEGLGTYDEETPTSPIGQAEQALVQLGYRSFEARQVLEAIYEEGMDLEDLIRLGLKEMNP